MVTSIFSFSYNVSERPLFQGRLKSGLCGKELSQFSSYPTSNLPHDLINYKKNVEYYVMITFSALAFTSKLWWENFILREIEGRA